MSMLFNRVLFTGELPRSPELSASVGALLETGNTSGRGLSGKFITISDHDRLENPFSQYGIFALTVNQQSNEAQNSALKTIQSGLLDISIPLQSQ